MVCDCEWVVFVVGEVLRFELVEREVVARVGRGGGGFLMFE